MDDYTPTYHFGIGVEQTIPIDRYSKLCSCVYCWNCFNGITCNKCNKLFCLTHTENHLCFIEKQITSHPITSGSKYNSDLMELVAV